MAVATRQYRLTRYCPRSIGVCAKAAVVAASKPANPIVSRRNICPSIASMVVKTRMDVSVLRPIVIGAKRYCCRECDDAGAQKHEALGPVVEWLHACIGSASPQSADLVITHRHFAFVPTSDSCTATKRHARLHDYSITSSAVAMPHGCATVTCRDR